MRTQAAGGNIESLQMILDNLPLIGYGFLALIVTLLGLRVLNSVFHNRARSKISTARSAAVAYRNGGMPKSKVQVRQTDIVSNLDREQVRKHRLGEQLIKENRLVEASKVFESISFQRRAIDLLEAGGLIDEAAEIMIRMKIPNRAAVLYERNNMLEKAAHFYSVGGSHENSGKLYMRMAATNYKQYQIAATEFEKAGKTLEQLKCHAHLLESQKVLDISTSSGQFDFLGQYMHLYANAAFMFRHLNESQIETLIESQPLTPLTLQAYSQWLQAHQTAKLACQILTKVADDGHLCKVFWETVPGQSRNWLTLQFKELKVNKDQITEKHCKTLDELKQGELGAYLSFEAGQPMRAIKSLAIAGMLDKCLEFLQQFPDSESHQILNEILSLYPSGPWTDEQVSKVVYSFGGTAPSAGTDLTDSSLGPTGAGGKIAS